MTAILTLSNLLNLAQFVLNYSKNYGKNMTNLNKFKPPTHSIKCK